MEGGGEREEERESRRERVKYLTPRGHYLAH